MPVPIRKLEWENGLGDRGLIEPSSYWCTGRIPLAPGDNWISASDLATPGTAIEERHRQYKCFWDLARMPSRKFAMIVNQVLFVLLAYTLLQGSPVLTETTGDEPAHPRAAVAVSQPHSGSDRRLYASPRTAP